MIFPYQQYGSSSVSTLSGVLFRPEIPIRVHGTAGNRFLYALVDSGSDDTILPLSLCDLVHAVVDPSQKWHVGGVGGKIEVVLGHVEFELRSSGQTFRWSATMGFADFAKSSDEANVLGHAGFLDYFTATFDEHSHSLELLPNANFSGTVS